MPRKCAEGIKTFVRFSIGISDMHCTIETVDGDVGGHLLSFRFFAEVYVSQSLGQVTDLEDEDATETQATITIEEHGYFLVVEEALHPCQVIFAQESEICGKDDERK